MFRRAMFLRSQRELTLAPQHPYEFYEVIIWLVFTYAQAFVEEFRKKDPKFQADELVRFTGLINRLVTGLFGTNADVIMAGFEQTYGQQNHMLEIASAFEHGHLCLLMDVGHPLIGLDAHNQYKDTVKLKVSGYAAGWTFLEEMVDVLRHHNASSMSMDACSSVLKRIKPLLPVLLATSFPGAHRLVNFHSFLSTWDYGPDRALVFVP